VLISWLAAALLPDISCFRLLAAKEVIQTVHCVACRSAYVQVRQLQQQLAAREQEVAALREIAEAATELQSQDVQAAKVIELSKKVTLQTCSVHHARTHHSCLSVCSMPSRCLP
jgi:hypothetical protein